MFGGAITSFSCALRAIALSICDSSGTFARYQKGEKPDRSPVEGARAPSLRKIAVVALLFPSILLTSCAGVPVETLRTYADAFQQARDAGNLLLDEISPIVSGVVSGRSSGQKCGRSRLGYPLCFDPKTALNEDGLNANEDISIRARRDALAAVAVYNKMLVDLAEGKSAAAINQRVDELTRLAIAIVEFGGIASGGLPALIGPGAVFAKSLVSRLERARANAAVREAILDSREDIQDLLTALAEDTPHIYAIFRAARDKDLVRLAAERRRANLRGDSNAEAQANIRFNAARESISRFHESLTAYVQLLDRTSEALDTLADAAEQSSRTTVADLEPIIREATEIRLKAEEFWKKIRQVRSAAAAAGV